MSPPRPRRARLGHRCRPPRSRTCSHSSYSSTSTFRKRADDTVFFDIPDRDATLASPSRCLFAFREPSPAPLTSLFRSGASPAAAACSLLGLRASRAPLPSQPPTPLQPLPRPRIPRGARVGPGARRTHRARADPLQERGGAGEGGGGGGRLESWVRRRGDAIGRRGASRDTREVPIETLFCGPALRGV